MKPQLVCTGGFIQLASYNWRQWPVGSRSAKERPVVCSQLYHCLQLYDKYEPSSKRTQLYDPQHVRAENLPAAGGIPADGIPIKEMPYSR